MPNLVVGLAYDSNPGLGFIGNEPGTFQLEISKLALHVTYPHLIFLR